MKPPKFMLHLIGCAFGLTRKYVSRNIGYHIKLNNSKSQKDLGLVYSPFADTVKDMVERMKELKLIKS